jgi:hypothetical protein
MGMEESGMSEVQPIWQRRTYASHEALAVMTNYMRRQKEVATAAGQKAAKTLKERTKRRSRV